MLSRDARLLAFTCVAGLNDAISYLELGHVFTAMMTGNTVRLAMAIGQGEVTAAVAVDPRAGCLPRGAGGAMVLVLDTGIRVVVLIVLSGFAMGVQAAAVRQPGQ